VEGFGADAMIANIVSTFDYHKPWQTPDGIYIMAIHASRHPITSMRVPDDMLAQLAAVGHAGRSATFVELVDLDDCPGMSTALVDAAVRRVLAAHSAAPMPLVSGMIFALGAMIAPSTLSVAMEPRPVPSGSRDVWVHTLWTEDMDHHQRAMCHATYEWEQLAGNAPYFATDS